ncbi:hypothetical protein [Bailinhaonella thermotolerans]|uniref:Lipoprotein LpqN n=1 Tax=Bailinhaonella thermotolerans TaxID=1070861 RepID=A0A3A4AS59_9ACTN|nr:hypothetical protein [Bailinhaonella thermotolerans]RJL30134.1 hypothetical protein D5H75_24755 [Bailinhaonella thermotolerans]
MRKLGLGLAVLGVLLAGAGCGGTKNEVGRLLPVAAPSSEDRPAPTDPPAPTPEPGESETADPGRPAAGTKVVTSSDRKRGISVPEGWKRMELNRDASIEVGDTGVQEFVIVITDKRAAAPSLGEYTKVVVGNLRKSVKNPQVTGPERTVINGMQARRYSVVASHPSAGKVAYYLTTVQGRTGYHQILAWTSAAHAPAAEPGLNSIITSFHELPR